MRSQVPPQEKSKDRILAIDAVTTEDLIEKMRAGFSVEALESLREHLGVSERRLAGVLRMSRSTMARRKKAGTLQTGESERVFRLASLFDQARDVLGSEERARRWLTSPQYALGGAVPLEYADTEPGARQVEHVLGRLAHGLPA